MIHKYLSRWLGLESEEDSDSPDVIGLRPWGEESRQHRDSSSNFRVHQALWLEDTFPRACYIGTPQRCFDLFLS